MQDREYRFIKYKILKLTGIDLNAYKTAQVQRRLRTYLLRSGHKSWPTFFRDVQDDPEALDKLKNYLTINVSSFFRDADKYEYLETEILPALLQQRRHLRVWSAGCSYGYEPYSLAILLAELTGVYRQHTILATDIDNAALAFSRAGGPYTAESLKNVPVALREGYFKACEDEGYCIVGTLRRRITFAYHDLTAGDFEANFDLIVCRNVIIYFEAEVKARLYKEFHEALRPGGILFVGGAEVIPYASKLGLESAGISFYRRVE